jgi:hypothetical protein
MNHNDTDWVIFSQSYLFLAKLGCQELIELNHKKYRNYDYQVDDLFVPILFNIKHGIEIYIKTLCILLSNKYNDKEHDINKLFEELEVKANAESGKLKPGAYEKNIITQKDIDDLPLNISEIKVLVSEFYTLNFLKNKIDNRFTIYDKKNDFLRYPDNKASVIVNWESIIPSIDIDCDIKKIKIKAEKLIDLFSKTGYIFKVILK